jgi:hypothetical protein
VNTETEVRVAREVIKDSMVLDADALEEAKRIDAE